MERLYLPNGESINIYSQKDLQSYLDVIRTLSNLENRENLWKERVRVEVESPMPFVFLMPLSDLHIGSHEVDYDELSKYLGLLKGYPIITALVGDLGDFFNPVRHPQGMQKNTSITLQINAMKKFFEEFKDKITCIVSDPSHVDWAYQAAGIDVYQLLANLYGIPLLQSGGILELSTGKTTYNIALFHKIAKFNSSFNPTHAGKRVLERHEEDIDIVVSGHQHRGGAEITPIIRGKKRAIIQMGTFKTKDEWGSKQGFVGRPHVFFPTLVLSRDKRDVEIIESPETVAEFIDAFAAYKKIEAVSLLGLRHGE